MRLLSGLIPLLLTATILLAGERVSPDRRFTWSEKDDFVTAVTFDRKGRRKEDRLRLPPLSKKGMRRRLLFAERGEFFCVLDEATREVGLHLDKPRGSSEAKTTVIASSLRLMDGRGKLRWTRRMRANHIVGSRDGSRALRLSPSGTLAMLLQDPDPYTRTRPLLLVIDADGTELLRLDYTSWTRIDDFALSDAGDALAVRGFGSIPDEETWGKAFAYYLTRDDARWVHRARRASGEGLPLHIAQDGWACCIKRGRSLLAFGPEGRTKRVDADEDRKGSEGGP
ncbi:hypothetical protein ACFL2T_00420 [Elusimicrobiota bacterium]